MKKRQIIYSTLKTILSAIWNVLLLAIYGTSKLTETVAGFLSKLTDKLLSKHN